MATLYARPTGMAAAMLLLFGSVASFSSHGHQRCPSRTLPVSLLQRRNFCIQRTSALFSFYVSPNEDDEDMIKSILGPSGTKRKKRGQSIFILSDTTGVTAKSAVEKGLAQFNGCDERYLSTDDDDDDPCELMQKTVYQFIRTEDDLARIIRKAEDRNSIVVFTFGDPAMRKIAAKLCQQSGLAFVDLLGPMFDVMSGT